MNNHFAEHVRLATIQKLAQRLPKKNDLPAVKAFIDDFFTVTFKAVMESELETTLDIARLDPWKDNDVITALGVDLYTDGIYRGYLAGIAAMEKLYLICEERPDEEEA